MKTSKAGICRTYLYLGDLEKYCLGTENDLFEISVFGGGSRLRKVMHLWNIDCC